VEIVSSLVEKTVPEKVDHTFSILDMGCGRGYLTFSLHYYLAEKYGGSKVKTMGIDVRPKLIAEMSTIARSLGGSFSSLKFEEGTIQQIVHQAATLQSDSASRKTSTEFPHVEILVALHACDTATDDALYAGILRNAGIIVVAPCCHKELRPQLDAHASSQDPILKHAIYRERMAETLTDSLRALLLELAGYKVQVFEFIGGEHTAKNVMITAVKSSHKTGTLPDLEGRIRSLAGDYGICAHKLAQWMGIGLIKEVDREGLKAKKIQVGRMPSRIIK
jgi:SAM-dependent methyltransferase